MNPNIPDVAVREKKKTDARWQFPLFQGILPFDKSRLAPDLIAGMTLAALGIPEVMGYTKIIGTPVITGLYTILLPMMVFAVFGSSRHLVVGADSATAAIVAAGLTALAVPYSPKYVALTSLVALMAGGMLLLARVLRLGFLADFLSRTVLVGFLTGVGIQVALGELHGLLGIEKGGHGFLGQLLFTLQHLPTTHLLSVLISLIVLAVIVGFERCAPRFPGALLAVVGMIIASAIFRWGDHGVTLVGEVPSGLPRMGLPTVSWSDIPLILSVSFAAFIVVLAQSAATSRAYALHYHEHVNENVDLVGLALANVAAGCSGTFVVNGSPTKTAMVTTTGGRSQVSQLTTSAVVLAVLLFLTRPLSYLPNAVLAAIVFLIGVKLIDHRGLAEISRRKPREFALAAATAATVVLVGVEQGILFAMVLSLLEYVRRGYQPHTGIVLYDPIDEWRVEKAIPGRMIVPGLLIYWFGAELFYANASLFTEQVRQLVNESPSPVRWLVIDAGAITAIDFTASKMIMELQRDMAKGGVVLALTRVNADIQPDLDRLGLTGMIGVNRIFASRKHCIEAYQAAR